MKKGMEWRSLHPTEGADRFRMDAAKQRKKSGSVISLRTLESEVEERKRSFYVMETDPLRPLYYRLKFQILKASSGDNSYIAMFGNDGMMILKHVLSVYKRWSGKKDTSPIYTVRCLDWTYRDMETAYEAEYDISYRIGGA